MLSKANRLRKNKDFERVLKQGKTLKGQFVILKYLYQGLSVSRFGFIISNKTIPKAVLRNHYRRQLRAIIRAHLDRIAPGYDITIWAMPSILRSNFKALDQEMQDLLKKAHLLS